MFGDFNAIISKISIYIIPVIFAVTLHEAGHAYAAKWLGDDTAQRQGRTSLNPLVHIDPIGTILMPLAMFILSAGSFFFGYAKPVPVVSSRLRNPAADMPVVALAGPAANVLMAILWAIFGVIISRYSLESAFFKEVAAAGIFTNLLFFAFNLLPLLPLDGGRILVGILPASIARLLLPLEQYGMFIIIFLAVSGNNFIWKYWVQPIITMMNNLIETLLTPLAMLLGAV